MLDFKTNDCLTNDCLTKKKGSVFKI